MRRRDRGKLCSRRHPSISKLRQQALTRAAHALAQRPPPRSRTGSQHHQAEPWAPTGGAHAQKHIKLTATGLTLWTKFRTRTTPTFPTCRTTKTRQTKIEILLAVSSQGSAPRTAPKTCPTKRTGSPLFLKVSFAASPCCVEFHNAGYLSLFRCQDPPTKTEGAGGETGPDNPKRKSPENTLPPEVCRVFSWQVCVEQSPSAETPLIRSFHVPETRISSSIGTTLSRATKSSSPSSKLIFIPCVVHACLLTVTTLSPLPRVSPLSYRQVTHSRIKFEYSRPTMTTSTTYMSWSREL